MAKEKQKQNAKSNGIMLLAILLLLFGLFTALFLAQRHTESNSVEEAGTSVHADHSSEYLVYEGIRYPVKSNITTVLLIGADSFQDDQNRIVEGQNRNRDLADFLVVLVLDHNKKTITPLQFNRDTICEVPWLDERGRVGGWRAEQLTFAHTYGSGAEDSCVNTVRTVRRLIYNAPVASYLAFTMDAVPLINDLVGGVTVTLTEDLPDLGKDYVKDASIKLRGQAALRFIRYREKTGGSNWFRMKRHRQYLYAFADAARAATENNPDLAVESFKRLAPFLCTNMSAENISRLVEQLCEYELLETLTPSGDIVPGEKFYEFYIHEDSLWSCVYSAYCVQKMDDSSYAQQ